MNIRTVVTATTALGLIGLIAVGCSSSTSDTASSAASGNCPAVGAAPPCPKDDAITQKDVDSCTKAKSDPKCGSQYVDALKCLGSNVACGADMKYDSAKGQAACKTQFDAYTKCAIAGAGGDAG